MGTIVDTSKKITLNTIMKIKQVINAALPSWYSNFKNVTFKTRILIIPAEFLEYLLSDGTLVLPKGSLHELDPLHGERSDDSEEWDAASSGEEVECPSFPVFEAKIKQSIQALGGGVLPKLNWSAPKDATWIACTSTLKCCTPGEIYLLLKSSDFVTHDLTKVFECCEDYDSNKPPEVVYSLILRRWHELNPGGEFRVFVKGCKIIALCQRHANSFYHFIPPNSEDIVKDIMQFYNRAIKGKYPDSDFVFDVYRKDKDKVYLVDFNPFGPVTDAILFTWDELESNAVLEGTCRDIITDLPPLRFISSAAGVQPSPYSMYAMPQDFVDLSTGSDPLKLIDFLQLNIQNQNEENSSSDEDEDLSIRNNSTGS